MERNCDWECQLGDCWGILTPPAFYTSFYLEVVCVWASIDWFFLSSHFDGLADGRKRFSDSLNFDLMSIAVVTCPDPCSECCEDDVSDEGICCLE